MTQKLKISLGKANAPNASKSDIDNAFLDLICLDRLGKNGIVDVGSIFCTLETEIRTFIGVLISLKDSQGKFPPVKWSIAQFHTDLLLSQLQEIDLSSLQICFV
ncbi:MAG: hypothetical protein K2I95_04610 [Treponemataceae bacterium]|nr:hypothetical protein [Treponemataceae bacterium]